MRAAIVVLGLALCGCGTEPSFDERYSQSQNEVASRARELDLSLNETNVATNSDGRIEAIAE